MRPLLSAAAALWLSAAAALAQGVAPIDTLYRALGLPEIIAIMRDEGIDYGRELQADLFGGRGGPHWHRLVDEIYDVDRMQAVVRNRLDSELAAENLAPMIAFFTSEKGREIVALEVSARRALLDEGIEEASREALEALILDSDPRLELLRDFAEAGELVENNVVGAMNSNYAFYTGLAAGGAYPGDLTEEQILTDVWSQEESIRAETEEWLYSYLNLAYRPLSDEDLAAYTAFFRTETGVTLNRAIFAAFDEMFTAVSLALGQGASRFLAGQEL